MLAIGLVIVSFASGMLTVLAPCILPVIPVILGSSTNTNFKNRFHPFVIVISLCVSVFVFSLLLKASTLLINIDPRFWTTISGSILFLYGVFTLFPSLWSSIETIFGLIQKSQELLQMSSLKRGLWGDILVGAALGPVFSSCSPTYSVILATILPVSFYQGVVYLTFYSFGLALALLPITYGGQKFIQKFKWASNPNGLFKKYLV